MGKDYTFLVPVLPSEGFLFRYGKNIRKVYSLNSYRKNYIKKWFRYNFLLITIYVS